MQRFKGIRGCIRRARPTEKEEEKGKRGEGRGGGGVSEKTGILVLASRHEFICCCV